MIAPLVSGSEVVSPSEDDASLARGSVEGVKRILARTARPAVDVQIDGESGESVSIPRSAFELLADILAQMAEGNAVTLIPVHAELTTQEAADILNVSRPFLIRLLDEGVIPHRKLNKHRRVRFEDLMNYKRKADSERERALDALAAQAQELDMGY